MLTHGHTHTYIKTQNTQRERQGGNVCTFFFCWVWSLVSGSFFRCSEKDKLATEPSYRTHALCPCSEQGAVCVLPPRPTTYHKVKENLELIFKRRIVSGKKKTPLSFHSCRCSVLHHTVCIRPTHPSSTPCNIHTEGGTLDQGEHYQL